MRIAIQCHASLEGLTLVDTISLGLQILEDIKIKHLSTNAYEYMNRHLIQTPTTAARGVNQHDLQCHDQALDPFPPSSLQTSYYQTF